MQLRNLSNVILDVFLLLFDLLPVFFEDSGLLFDSLVLLLMLEMLLRQRYFLGIDFLL